MATADDNNSDWDESIGTVSSVVSGSVGDEGDKDKDSDKRSRDKDGIEKKSSPSSDTAGITGRAAAIPNHIGEEEDEQGHKEKENPCQQSKQLGSATACGGQRHENGAANANVLALPTMTGVSNARDDDVDDGMMPGLVCLTRNKRDKPVATKLEVPKQQHQATHVVHQDVISPNYRDLRNGEISVVPPRSVLNRSVGDPKRLQCTAGNGSFHDSKTVTERMTTDPSQEQTSLRQDIVSLREDEQETCSVLSTVGVAAAERGGCREADGIGDGVDGGDIFFSSARNANPCGHTQEERQYLPADQNQQNIEATSDAQKQQTEPFVLSPSGLAKQPLAVSSANTLQVGFVDEAVSAFSLANAVKAALDAPRTTYASPVEGNDNEQGRQHMQHVQHVPLWSLTIHRCHLSSLFPVAGLHRHLGGMCSLQIDGSAGLALAGLELVLANALCLRNVTLRRCGLVQLPQLQSGSVEALDVSDNVIKNAAGLETLFRLKWLNLAGNDVRGLADLRPLVPLGTGSLRELILAGNSVQDCPRCENGRLEEGLPLPLDSAFGRSCRAQSG